MAQFTKKAIMESYKRMIAVRPLDKITVKDIVEDCEITRNTFYYHFQDIYDLTVQAFSSEISEAVKKSNDGNTWEEVLIDIFTLATQNRKAIQHIYSSSRRSELLHGFGASVNEAIRSMVSFARPEDQKILADFYRSALLGMTCDWIESGMKEVPEQVIHRVRFLMEGSILRAARRSISPRQNAMRKDGYRHIEKTASDKEK